MIINKKFLQKEVEGLIFDYAADEDYRGQIHDKDVSKHTQLPKMVLVGIDPLLDHQLRNIAHKFGKRSYKRLEDIAQLGIKVLMLEGESIDHRPANCDHQASRMYKFARKHKNILKLLKIEPIKKAKTTEKIKLIKKFVMEFKNAA